MTTIVYPRTYRVTYREDWLPQPAETLAAMHDSGKPPERSPIKIIDVDCHVSITDQHFMHFSIIKRFDVTRDVPVWLHKVSIPYVNVLFCELVRDDSDHAVPQEALDLDVLHQRTQGRSE